MYKYILILVTKFLVSEYPTYILLRLTEYKLIKQFCCK